MEAKQPPASKANLLYEDFEPPFEWVVEDGSDILIFYLPGFRKENLRVQVTSTRNLRVSGERQLADNKVRRFRKEFPIPSDCDSNDISAKFETGMLYVRHPKIIAFAEPEAKITKPTQTEAEAAPKPSPKPLQEPQAQQPAAQGGPSKPTKEDKQENQKRTTLNEEAKTSGISQEASNDTTGKDSIEEAKDTNYVGRKSNEEEIISSGMGEEGKGITSSKDEKHEGGKRVGEMGKKEGETLGSGHVDGKRRHGLGEGYGEIVGGLLTEIKKQKKVVNLALAVVMVVGFGLYIKNFIEHHRGASTSEEL